MMNKNDYKNIFVFAEQRGGKIQPVALELIGKASDLAAELGEKVVAMLLGHNVSSLAQELIEYGADEVIVADAPELENYITEEYAQVVSQIADKYLPSIILFGATTIGRDFAPRLSARLTTGLTADCTKLEISEGKELMMTRPAFGGNLMATIMCTEHRPQMSTVRPGVMQKKDRQPSREGVITNFEVKIDMSRVKVKLIEEVKAEKDNRIDISEANILVSGGRGVGTKENFAKLTELADVLNAQVSASRAVVDAGVIPHDRQVGQTGKTVRPNLYFALGISGAIQHLAGMEESDYIIAINKDKFAPIYSVSDLGIVGDVNKIIPLLTERLKKEFSK